MGISDVCSPISRKGSKVGSSNEPLPSISEEMQRQIEADQTDIRRQLKHANEQIALTNVYPGRRGDTRSP